MLEKNIQCLYEEGYSISEIAKKLGRSNSGIVYHLKKEGVAMRSRSDAVRNRHHKKLNSHSAYVNTVITKKNKELYCLGLALYWGEGSKTGGTVAITNSDPGIILMFLKFLRVLCNIDEHRLRILIHYHLDQNEEELIKYWSKVTKINKKNFYKSTIHRSSLKNSTKRLKFGTISLRYADSLLLKDILSRIEILRKL